MAEAKQRTKKASSKDQTPLMRQYYKIKDRHPNAVLLFRLGDFYETFEDDAHTVSRVLGITLTRRANGKASEVPLAGFPHHALDTYLPKLIQAGLRVAICEQLEDPKYARKVVKRDVVEVVTPGVSFHDQLLSPKQSNYLAAVHFAEGRAGGVGFAYLDASTGEFAVTEVETARLNELLQSIMPSEILVDKRYAERLRALPGLDALISPQEDWCFGYDFAYETLLRHFKTHSLKGFGVEDLNVGLVAAGAALYYLSETQKGRLTHIQRITRYASDAYMMLDAQTRRNLELVAAMQGGRREGSLVQILDETRTPMGARLLRNWLVRPLKEVRDIERRLDAVEAFVASGRLRESVRDELRQVGDLERTAAKVSTGRASPRDLKFLQVTLGQIPRLRSLLSDERCDTLRRLVERLDPCLPVVEMIRTALVDEPPATLNDGGFIRPGYSEELDALRDIARSGKDWVARMQKQESERTGIPSLKVGFNKVFGYYIEITNAHKAKVPDDYIRKQTLVNAERYITPSLKEYEEKILTAEERIVGLETELFQALRQRIADQTAAFQLNALYLAMLDCFAALAEVADRYGYTRPEVHEGHDIRIIDGRHPVVERSLPAGDAFIPNSVVLDPDEHQILIITGPNMAGKSVVLRQTGLIVLLAQIGAFVPAESARIGRVDRIFTRVGASDNLAAGESTFLVEMNEAANILNNATPRSLILLDEIGRGTSTFDGLSIAWAIVEYLHESPPVAARTLFATHYHELNELAARFPRIRNMRIQVQEHDGKVIFLRKLIEGGADHSYGIEVARMAGLPEPIVQRARQILRHLESQHLDVERLEGDALPEETAPAAADAAVLTAAGPAHAGRRPRPDRVPAAEETFQMSLFAPDPKAADILERLRGLDVDRMTPVEALMLLAELKRRAE